MIRLFRHDGDFTVDRVTEILRAADDPAKITRLMMTELEGALAAARALASERLANRHAWQRRMGDARLRQETWGERAEFAMSAGREDLARAALQEKQKALNDTASLATEAAVMDEIVRDSEERLARIQYLLSKLKTRRVPLGRPMTWH